MSMGPPVIDRIDDRHAAVVAHFRAHLPERHVKQSWIKTYTDHLPQELADGVVQIVSGDESKYVRGRGMVGKRGTQEVILICYLRLEESDLPEVLAAAEQALAEDIKAVARLPLRGVGLDVVEVQMSRQIEHPYGWVLVFIEAGPPKDTLN